MVPNRENPVFEGWESRSHIELTLVTSGMSKHYIHISIYNEMDGKCVKKNRKTEGSAILVDP